MKLRFDNDYMEGCHPVILDKLVSTNLSQTPGYGCDQYCHSAAQHILKECDTPDADVWFITGGTQTNSTVIDAILRRTEGIIAATSGHISVHEAGAIEAWGHKVIEFKSEDGKLYADDIANYVDDFYSDATYPHMISPGAVYISFPTELGTLYTRKELTEISQVCHERKLTLYLDGARLGYGLMSDKNDVSIKDIANLCDVFYIGGTKIGALFGEAVVVPHKEILPNFFTTIKQHGALLAKGRLLGLQFETLFENGLYYHISKHAVDQALRIQSAFKQNGYKLAIDSPTNQQFIILPNNVMDKLAKNVSFEIWGKRGKSHTTVRFVTSWATKTENVDQLINYINNLKN